MTVYNPVTLAAAEAISKGAIDKDRLFGVFNRSQERKNKMEDMAIAKALDVPLDDEVRINNTSMGLNGWPLVAALGIGAYLLLGYLGHPAPTQTPPPAPGVQVPDVQVQLYYDDPVEGLVPIPGAASLEGGQIPAP